MVKINKAIALREAADRIWELSHQYNDAQIVNLLRDLASELHTEARKHENESFLRLVKGENDE